MSDWLQIICRRECGWASWNRTGCRFMRLGSEYMGLLFILVFFLKLVFV